MTVAPIARTSRLRRFYRDARVAAGVAEDFSVTLDGRPLRTPAGRVFAVPQAALAEGIAGEWRAQGEEIAPDAMPLTRLAATALDRVAPRRGEVIDHLVRFAATDLVCYRVDTPAALAARQRAAWDPLLAWVGEAFDAGLAVTEALAPVAQPPAALARLRDRVAAHDAYRLVALDVAGAATASLVIALALVAGRLDAAAALEASLVEERYQAGIWGSVPEAEARIAGLGQDLHALTRYLALLDG